LPKSVGRYVFTRAQVCHGGAGGKGECMGEERHRGDAASRKIALADTWLIRRRHGGDVWSVWRWGGRRAGGVVGGGAVGGGYPPPCTRPNSTVLSFSGGGGRVGDEGGWGWRAVGRASSTRRRQEPRLVQGGFVSYPSSCRSCYSLAHPLFLLFPQPIRPVPHAMRRTPEREYPKAQTNR